MIALFRPTLVRRLLLTLLAAFFLCWIAIMALIQTEALSQENQEKGLREFASFAIDNLSRTDNPVVASNYLNGLIDGNDRLNYDTRKSVIWTHLWDNKGNLLYSNVPPRAAPEIEASLRLTARAANNEFFVARENTPLWTLSVARGRHHFMGVLLDVWADLSRYFLIAFPVIFLPIWFGVSRGLRPLQLLSERITARHAGNLSALNIDPKYDELKPLVATLDHLLLALRNKIEREHAFLSDAAHELRTPLAVMMAQTHVLAMADSPNQRAVAEQRMEQAISRSSHLIAQLLQLAHVGHESAATYEPIDVAQLVQEELALAAPGALARNIELTLEAPDTLWRALERNALQSILHNLVDNAIRYVQPGGKIDVKLVDYLSALSLTVCDNGPGIAPSEHNLMFERFHRGVGHDIAGSGLGLAIVKRAAEKLGGTVVLTNGPGNVGCQFVVTLPSSRTAQ